MTVDEQDGYAEQQLRERGGHHALHARKRGRFGPAEHGTHGQVEEGHGEGERDDELASLLVYGALCRPLRVHESRRLGREVRPVRVRALRMGSARRGTVARLPDGGLHRAHGGSRPVIFELHRVLEQVDVGGGDAGNARRSPLDPGRTGSAGHARDIEGLAHGTALRSAILGICSGLCHRQGLPSSRVRGSDHMNFLKSRMTSSVTSVSPAWMRSTTQV